MALIRQRGDSWQAWIRKKKDGVLVHEESRNFKTEKLAKDWAKRAEALIEVNGIPKRVLSTQTLGELLTKHRATLDNANPEKPIRRQMGWLLNQLAVDFANVKLSDLSSKVFVDFAYRKAAQGKAGGATILHNLIVIQGMLKSAKALYNLDINGDSVRDAISALSRLGVVHPSEERTRRPSPDELNRLEAEFKRTFAYPQTKIPMAAYLRLAIELPRRREEICTMLWEDYDGVQITLRDTKDSKVKRTETIPVTAAAASIIDSIPKIDARIFPYNPESVSAAFQGACNRLGIDDLHLHDLRHEGISRLFSRGLNIPHVALLSGHRSWASLKRYTQITPSEVLEELNARSQKTQKAAAKRPRPGPHHNGNPNGASDRGARENAGGDPAPGGRSKSASQPRV